MPVLIVSKTNGKQDCRGGKGSPNQFITHSLVVQGGWAGQFGQSQMLVLSTEMLTRPWMSCWLWEITQDSVGSSELIASHTHVSSRFKYVPQTSFAVCVLCLDSMLNL